MAKTKVLVTVKTYPTLSQKYDELVCTAGFLEDGSWIRVYPVPFRKLDTRYTADTQAFSFFTLSQKIDTIQPVFDISVLLICY